MGIRNMATKDYDGVYALWMACAGMGLNNLDDSREGIHRFIARNPETCFVYEANGVIMGVILAGNDGRRGYIYHVAVDPAHRRRGIGASLVESSLEALKRLGIHKVALVVFAKNREGNAFWERNGFTVREDLVYRNKLISEMIRIDT